MLKTLIDNWGMLRVMSHLMKSVGGARGLKLFSQYDRYYTAEAVKAALACGASCEKPGNDFQRLLFDVARRRLGKCPPLEVERPREPMPALMREYFEMVEDVVVNKACELAAKPVRDVIPEEEARALYQALVSANFYKAFRVSLYLGIGAAKWGRVLLIGSGTQEPLDFLKACELAGAKCEVAAMEVDEAIYRDLARLRGGDSRHTWAGTPSANNSSTGPLRRTSSTGPPTPSTSSCAPAGTRPSSSSRKQ